MARGNIKIKAKQVFGGRTISNDGSPDRIIYEYEVLETLNTTVVTIGERLSKHRLDELMEWADVKVVGA